MTGLSILVDADAHIDVSLKQLAPFIDEPWRGHIDRGNTDFFLPEELGDRLVAGRIRRPLTPGEAQADAAAPFERDLRVVFPTQLLPLSIHPNVATEAAVAVGYARWLTGVYLPQHPDACGMLYLPLGDADAARDLVKAFGESPGVVGVFVTNATFLPTADNRYLPLWAELEARGLVLGFHPLPMWQDRPFDMFDRYLAVWAMGYPFTQCIHLVNWVLEGVPARFPRLRCIFYEAGLSWLTFVAHRVDGEFLKRPSEAPLLRERPSHYMRRMSYCTQPLDQAPDPRELEGPVRLVGADRLVFGSNYPQWDFDLPSAVLDLPFLEAAEREAILGENAARLFNLSERKAGRTG